MTSQYHPEPDTERIRAANEERERYLLARTAFLQLTRSIITDALRQTRDKTYPPATILQLKWVREGLELLEGPRVTAAELLRHIDTHPEG